MTPKKPDRWQRLIDKQNTFQAHNMEVMSVKRVVELLRKEHAWMRRMVQANLALWEGPDVRGNYTNQYGRDCRAAQCREILDQLTRRVK